jgi:predicted RNA-binding protein YlqC (UPF0109 family)
VEDLVAYLARRLVDEPDQVRVDAESDGDTLRLRLTVAPEDVGKVIGKQGRIIRAIRTVVRSGGARRGQRVMLEIVE